MSNFGCDLNGRGKNFHFQVPVSGFIHGKHFFVHKEDLTLKGAVDSDSLNEPNTALLLYQNHMGKRV